MTARAKKASATTGKKGRPAPLFDGAEWDFETLQRTYEAIEIIALEDLGLDVYPNQIEIISSEQMLDAYCSIGMPLMYEHWSFGKRFIHDEERYRKGYQGLAYEIVINSSPCISYCMEENTMAVQALVMAHAAFGHNHFFKNNYLFQQWTDAEAILDYLDFAKHYVTECEERHGVSAVEEILDAAHALMDQSVFRYRRPSKLKQGEEEERRREHREHDEKSYCELWRTLPVVKDADQPDEAECETRERKARLNLPEENILYFLEKNSPGLEDWQRELLRIVRNTAQYFYPQKQTKMMNEGCATFVHYHIVNELYDRGQITEGALLEILHSHSNVVFQPGFDDQRFSGLNPYALGFAMMQDIKRICTEPTDEDRDWFPGIAGNDDWRATLKDVWANYRDESFILQFLSPRLIREFKLFLLSDKASQRHVSVDAIHNEQGYEKVRKALAASYDVTATEPDIQIVDVDLHGDRELVLRHSVHNGIVLDEKTRVDVLDYVGRLWGYAVRLEGIDLASGRNPYTERVGGPGEKSDD
ncbi:MAG: SpoVR family protein [Alphaproteobacteria bacterium]|nr:SpoVR family protein [Alphaproteobacteria bacterium]